MVHPCTNDTMTLWEKHCHLKPSLSARQSLMNQLDAGCGLELSGVMGMEFAVLGHKLTGHEKHMQYTGSHINCIKVN